MGREIWYLKHVIINELLQEFFSQMERVLQFNKICQVIIGDKAYSK